MPKPARIDIMQIAALAQQGLTVKRIAMELRVSPSYITQVKKRFAAGAYSVDGPPIGADLEHRAEVERGAHATMAELARLRAHASRPAYG